MNIKSIDNNNDYSLIDKLISSQLMSQQMLTDDPTHHFCYFDIRNQQTLITQSILLFLSLVIFSIAVKKYREIWVTLSSRNRNANLAYLAILAWWISSIYNNTGYIAKDIYGLLIYIVYNMKTNVTQQLSWFSKFYFALDWGNAFMLQTVLLFMPYHSMRQIAQALSAVSGGGGDSQSGIQDGLNTISYKGVQAKVYPVLQKYLLVRILSVVPIILFLALTDFNTISLISKILLSILLIDCSIIIIVLSAGIYSLKTNQLLKMQLDQDQVKTILNQYLIIICCTFFRFAYCLFVFIYGAKQKLTQDDCSLTSQTQWSTLMFIVLITIFAHYLPILIILRIYTVQQKPHDITKSLIID